SLDAVVGESTGAVVGQNVRPPERDESPAPRRTTPAPIGATAPAIPARDRRRGLLEDSAPGLSRTAPRLFNRARGWSDRFGEGDAVLMSPARPPGASRLATYFHVHLVSDSTGETLNAMAKAVIARFDGVIPIEHIYALVRSTKQMDRVLEEVAAAPGVVLHTLVDRDLREQLEEG